MVEKKAREGYIVCQETECLWNVDCLHEGLNISNERETIALSDNGVRICKYDKRAIILGLPIPTNCPYKEKVYEAIRSEAVFNSLQAMGTLKIVDDYIRVRANEARSRLGLSTVSSG